MKERIIRFNVKFVSRHYKSIAIISTILLGVCFYIVISKFRINSDFADMLPAGKRSVVDQEIIRERVGSPEYIQVVFQTDEVESDFIKIKDLAEEIEFHARIGSFSITQDGLKTNFHFILNKKILPDFLGKDVEFFIERVGKAEPIFKFNGNVIEINDFLNEVVIEIPEIFSKAEEKSLIENIREGDTNNDGIYSMEIIKENLHLIADAIGESPLVQDVIYKFDPDFFKQNRLLYAKIDELQKLHCCIIEKQKDAIKKELSVSEEEDRKEEEEFEEDVFHKKEEEEGVCKEIKVDLQTCFKEEKTISKYEKIQREFPEYFISNSGYLTFFIRPIKPSTDIDFNKRVQEEVKDIIKDLINKNPLTLGKVLNPEMIGLGGGYPEKLFEIKRLYKDIFNSISFTVSLLLITLILYFKRFRSIPLVMIPLIFGIIYTLSIFFLTIGYLNLITVFIFGILFGLGIDYGIHMLSRFIEERKNGRDILDALFIIQSTTGKATFYSALTTIVAFYVLLFSNFKGFSQFGLIAGTGIILCLLSVFIIFPSFLILSEKIREMKFKVEKSSNKKISLNYNKKFPFEVALLSTLLFIGFFFISFKFIPKIKFEYDFRKLIAKNPELHKINEIKTGATRGLTLSPSIALADNLEEAKKTWEKLKNMDKETVKFVASIFNLIPENQNLKLDIIDKIRKLIEKKRDFVEDEVDLKNVDELYSLTDVKNIEIEDIPEDYKKFFRETPVKSGEKIELKNSENLNHNKTSLGNIIYIFPEKNLGDGKEAIKYSEKMADFSLNGKKIPIGSSAIVMADVIRTVKEEGPKISSFSLLSVFLIILFSYIRKKKQLILILINHFLFIISGIIYYEFYNNLALWKIFSLCIGISLIFDIFLSIDALKKALIVIFPLFLSIVFSLSTMYLFSLKLNLFNIVVFPIAMGIGIDNCIHLLERYTEEGRGKILKVLRFTGPPVFMSSLTTIIGFSGVLFTEHKGLFSIGLLSVIVMSCVIISSLLFFPLFLRCLEFKKPDKFLKEV